MFAVLDQLSVVMSTTIARASSSQPMEPVCSRVPGSSPEGGKLLDLYLVRGGGEGERRGGEMFLGRESGGGGRSGWMGIDECEGRKQRVPRRKKERDAS